jgi:2-(1,2-epoxy-1,2-dihydrophenyl)acetyl-CoA isomerase
VPEAVLLDTIGGVATITLNRPESLNAFDRAMHEGLYGALDSVAADEGVRCVVLRGEGRGFSAGADLRSEDLKRGDGEPPDLGGYLRATYGRTVAQLAALEKPVLASLHGPVYGAGLGLALACDLRVAARSAVFSVAFVKIGLVPDAGVSFFLPRIVGLGRAIEMSMTGEPIDAEEAHRIGLVSRVFEDEDLGSKTTALADRLASMPTTALAGIRRTLYASFEGDLGAALENEAREQTVCGYTEDHAEGLAAFFERREARFTGR